MSNEATKVAPPACAPRDGQAAQHGHSAERPGARRLHAPEHRRRAEFVAGLRRLADLLEDRDDLPVDLSICAYAFLGGTEDDQQREIERIAAELDVPALWNDTHTHLRACLDIGGGVTYLALHITDHAMALHRAHTSYAGAVTP